MWTGLTDFDRTFAALERFRRQMDRLFQDFDGGGPASVYAAQTTWPRANLFDAGNKLVLQLEVPGLAQKDIQINATQDAVAVSGERKTNVPQGYAVHRTERGGVRFARTFALPTRITVERTTAGVRNGLLTITMEKSPEAQPRQITVKAQ